MKLEVKKEKENPLYSRKEYDVDLSFDKSATPSNVDFAKQMAKLVKVDIKNIIVKQINTKFGSTTGKGLVYVYENVEKLKRIELKVPNYEEKKAEEKKD